MPNVQCLENKKCEDEIKISNENYCLIVCKRESERGNLLSYLVTLTTTDVENLLAPISIKNSDYSYQDFYPRCCPYFKY